MHFLYLYNFLYIGLGRFIAIISCFLVIVRGHKNRKQIKVSSLSIWVCHGSILLNKTFLFQTTRCWYGIYLWMVLLLDLVCLSHANHWQQVGSCALHALCVLAEMEKCRHSVSHKYKNEEVIHPAAPQEKQNDTSGSERHRAQLRCPASSATQQGTGRQAWVILTTAHASCFSFHQEKKVYFLQGDDFAVLWATPQKPGDFLGIQAGMPWKCIFPLQLLGLTCSLNCSNELHAESSHFCA